MKIVNILNKINENVAKQNKTKNKKQKRFTLVFSCSCSRTGVWFMITLSPTWAIITRAYVFAQITSLNAFGATAIDAVLTTGWAKGSKFLK